MGRSSNDDRSDNMNPNNETYWASEANRAHQLGDDNDEGEYSASGSGTRTHHSYMADPPPPSVAPANSLVPDVAATMKAEPATLYGVYMLIVSTNEKKQRIRVDARNIEEAIGDAKALWNDNPLAYLVLYDRKSIYMEETRAETFPAGVKQSIASLADLEDLIARANSLTSAARRSMDSESIRGDRHWLEKNLAHYGACAAAVQGLRAEREERIADLHMQGYNVTKESASEFGLSGKLAQLVEDNAQFVQQFQAGKANLDPIVEAFIPHKRITALNA